MSSAAIPIQPIPSSEPVFPLSVEQYHAMIDAGVLTDDDPVELLEGVLVFKMPKKPSHRLALRKLFKAVDRLLSDNEFMQLQEPITLSDGEPEPDAAIIRGRDEDYADRHPGPSDVELVIEVADTTLRRDRGIKLRSYARAGITAYWIVNLADRCVEIYTRPDPQASPPTYAPPIVFDEKASVPLEIGGKKVGAIAVASILV